MYAEERRHALVELAREHGRLAVADVAERFDVTPETVRRDLDMLDRAGVLRRVHGGAVPLRAVDLGDLPLSERETTAAAEKDRIATRALLEFPTDAGAAVILDAGTTTGRLAARVPLNAKTTVFTNSVSGAATLSSRTECDVHLTGGRVRRVTQAVVGSSAVDTLSNLRAQVAFMGTNGLSADHGCSTPDYDEAEVKRAMIAASARVIVLADSRKMGAETLVSFVPISGIDMVITDDGISAEVASALTSEGIEVVIA